MFEHLGLIAIVLGVISVVMFARVFGLLVLIIVSCVLLSQLAPVLAPAPPPEAVSPVYDPDRDTVGAYPGAPVGRWTTNR